MFGVVRRAGAVLCLVCSCVRCSIHFLNWWHISRQHTTLTPHQHQRQSRHTNTLAMQVSLCSVSVVCCLLCSCVQISRCSEHKATAAGQPSVVRSIHQQARSDTTQCSAITQLLLAQQQSRSIESASAVYNCLAATNTAWARQSKGKAHMHAVNIIRVNKTREESRTSIATRNGCALPPEQQATGAYFNNNRTLSHSHLPPSTSPNTDAPKQQEQQRRTTQTTSATATR